MLTKYWTVVFRVPKRFLSSVKSQRATIPKSGAPRISVFGRQVQDYLKPSATFAAHCDNINPKLFKGVIEVPSTIYCTTEDAAETVFSALRDHLSVDVPIFENCPGLGLVTRKLLQLNPAQITAFEPDAYFSTVMDSIECPNLKVYKLHYLDIIKEEFKDIIDGQNRVKKFFKGVTPKDWKSDPAIQIIGIGVDAKTMLHLVTSITHQKGAVAYGRPAFFMYMSLSRYSRINSFSQIGQIPRSSRDLLFSIYFDTEILCSIDRKCFLPWPRTKKQRSTTNIPSYNELYLVKVVPKKELLEQFPDQLLKVFWYFVYQSFLCKSTKVIPFLEKWIPGCGLAFLAKGFNIFTEFRELTYAELFDIFYTFVSHPDFENSSFLAAVDTHFFASHNFALKDVEDYSVLDNIELDDRDDDQLET